jgi:hypothetical protein
MPTVYINNLRDLKARASKELVEVENISMARSERQFQRRAN